MTEKPVQKPPLKPVKPEEDLLVRPVQGPALWFGLLILPVALGLFWAIGTPKKPPPAPAPAESAQAAPANTGEEAPRPDWPEVRTNPTQQEFEGVRVNNGGAMRQRPSGPPPAIP